MGFPFWVSIGAGGAVMAAHAALRVLTHRFALGYDSRRMFLLLELGGMSARMALVFAAVAVILLYAPVHAGAFVGTVLVLLILSMIFEARLVFQRMEQDELCS